MSTPERSRRGPRVVLALYVSLVTLAGVIGFLVGSIGPDDLQAVSFLGLVTFDPTPFGMAAYGVATVGTALTVGILLVVLASRYDRRPT
ncbi:cox cluster protein [Halobacteriaceae archaeon GCM10025711]